jgi:DNA-binding NarL/FixJ family response regulator
MKTKIQVIIMDDHQSIEEHPVDVLILDVEVPASATNSNPYAILHTIPKLLQQYPNLAILVISMHNEPGLIRAIVEAGAVGYILKSDSSKIQELGKWILSLVNGEPCFSDKVLRVFPGRLHEPFTPRQLEALSLCAAYPNSKTAELAAKMKIANSTLRNLLSTVYLKLGVQTRAAAIAKARQMGIITSDSALMQP